MCDKISFSSPYTTKEKKSFISDTFNLFIIFSIFLFHIYYILFRSDSTFATPYGKWKYYDDSIKTRPQDINYAANKVHKWDHGPLRVLKGPQGTEYSMEPIRDQDLDPEFRVQDVGPEYGPKVGLQNAHTNSIGYFCSKYKYESGLDLI